MFLVILFFVLLVPLSVLAYFWFWKYPNDGTFIRWSDEESARKALK